MVLASGCEAVSHSRQEILGLLVRVYQEKGLKGKNQPSNYHQHHTHTHIPQNQNLTSHKRGLPETQRKQGRSLARPPHWDVTFSAEYSASDALLLIDLEHCNHLHHEYRPAWPGMMGSTEFLRVRASSLGYR